MPKEARLIIFDLGNVIFKVDSIKTFEYWSKLTGKDPEFLWNAFFSDNAYLYYELGEISEDRMRKHFSKKINFNLSKSDFIDGFNLMITGVNPGIQPILQRLKGKYFLSALSNTNKTHERYMLQNFVNIITFFDKLFFSHRMKCRKPEEKAFLFPLQHFRVNPENCIFFDDSEENVQGALKLGINAFLINPYSSEEIEKTLKEYLPDY